MLSGNRVVKHGARARIVLSGNRVVEHGARARVFAGLAAVALFVQVFLGGWTS